jgi:hypothetical protein
MPVFQCNSCQRLLYRPEELLGRAWQCPNCGPTVVSEEAVDVSEELAALLKKEYDLYVFVPPTVSVPLPATDSGSNYSVPLPPTHSGGKYQGQNVLPVGNDPLARKCISITLIAAIIWVLLVVIALSLSLDLFDSALIASGLVAGTWIAICAVLLLVHRLLDARNRRKVERDDEDSDPALAPPAQGTPAARVGVDMRFGPTGNLLLLMLLAVPVVLFALGIAAEMDALLVAGAIACMMLLGLAMLALLVHVLLAMHRRQLLMKMASFPRKKSSVQGGALTPDKGEQTPDSQHIQRRTNVSKG